MRDDGRIDLTLSRAGKGKVVDFSDKFMNYLVANDGVSRINDKSSPEDIARVFGVSKKAFKATVGHLLKQGKISIAADGIKLK